MILLDTFANASSVQPRYDTVQNILSFNGSNANGITTISFTRYLNTNDTTRDVAIVDGNLYLVYAYSLNPGFGTGSIANFDQHWSKGAIVQNFVNPAAATPVASPSPLPVNITPPSGPSYTEPAGNFKITIEVEANAIHYSMSAKTSGWLALGWNTIAAMRTTHLPFCGHFVVSHTITCIDPADVCSGWINSDGSVVLRDEWASAYVQPRLDTALGGTSDVNLTGASFADGWTTITFRKPKSSGAPFSSFLISHSLIQL